MNHFSSMGMSLGQCFDVLDSALETGDLSVLYPLVSDRALNRLAVELAEHRRHEPSPRFALPPRFLQSLFQLNASCLTPRECISALKKGLEVHFLRRAVKDSNPALVSEILARHAEDLAQCVNEGGYPLNAFYLGHLDFGFLAHCEDALGNCKEPVILDEFFKYPFFAWQVANKLSHAIQGSEADLAEYLVSKLSKAYYSLSSWSLSNRADLAPAAYTYRSCLQTSFLDACSYGLAQSATALAQFDGMDVEKGFITAILGGHQDVLLALVQACGTARIPSQEGLLASLQHFGYQVLSQLYTTFFNYAPVPTYFASIQDFVQFLEKRVSLIARRIDLYYKKSTSQVHLVRLHGGDEISEDERMKRDFEAIIRAVQAYLKLVH